MALTPAVGDEPIVVSVYLRPDARAAASARRAGDPRATLRASRETAHANDLAGLTAFAKANGLTVVVADLARRLVKLGGPASALARAFGADVQ